MDAALKAARDNGAAVIVSDFPDPIGRDAVIQWPGGVNMQLYWHTKTPDYAAFQTLPENRVYLSADRADTFIRSFLGFSHGKVLADDKHASAVDVGQVSGTYRRVEIESPFGRMTVLVTDGQLPYPFGHETTGYQVADLTATLGKATGSGAKVLVPAFTSKNRRSALVNSRAAISRKFTSSIRCTEPMPMTRRTGWGLAVLWPLLASSGHASDWPHRPAIKTNRWQEDWSVLSDPALRTQPLDSLKYLPLSSANPFTYLSPRRNIARAL